MSHPNQHLYPIIDDEFNTRFFDPSLVEAVIEADQEFFADPAMKQYIQEGDAPMNWETMSLLEQIKCQIGFVAPPPRRSVSAEDELSAEDRWALKVEKAINAVNASTTGEH